jgi:hypothetical protein
MHRNVTNKFLLPHALVHAVSYDRYEAGDGDISCTTLIGPPQIRRLKKKHGKQIKEDASELIWSLLGSAVHFVLENATIHMKETGEWHDNYITEQRFYHEFDHISGPKKVSAQIDLYEDGDLSDFKVTSIWAIKDAIENGKDEWDAQLNVQRFLMEKNGHKVKNLYIVAIARDWSKAGMMRDPNSYPPRCVKLEIPMWSMEKTQAYIDGRLNAHYALHNVPCTPKECWEKPTMYALMKKGRQSALRVMDSMDRIMAYAKDKSLTEVVEDHEELKKDHYYEVRPGIRTRCEDYCEVQPFCEQYQEWKASMEKDDEPVPGAA